MSHLYVSRTNQGPDHNDALEIQRQIHALCAELDKLSYSVGLAKQTLKYSRDRNKNTLAKYVDLQPAAESAVMSEMMARVDPRFLADMEQHQAQDLAAEQALARESALKSQLDAKRSLLSYAKAQMGL